MTRIAENFYLEKIQVALAQGAAEHTYEVAEAKLTAVPWTAQHGRAYLDMRRMRCHA
ncbi:hypothetical protein AB0M44_12380 [Streptosporangium subroseum]|uniref:hypothetical protein n=1 Tax=Streptosporangium subroseum TaxID=106412 RepID=UPI00308E1510|nr:hypothetical protein OHB15_46160 [Streptosporangium subroseum]